ncbi:MAG TPA: SPOR domain-containing protein [Burkholderiales bacterium]|nr:SPOR domain-containing protein [Burkholderiales bacterium]
MTRESTQKAQRSARGPSWMSLVAGLLAGLVIGLGIAFVVAWYVNKMPNPFAQKANGAAATRAEATKADAAKVDPLPRADPKIEPRTEAKPAAKSDPKVAKVEEEKSRFDFYKILPGSEEPVSDRDLKRSDRKSSTTPSKDVYFLQAGAFQNAADADNMKARLALMGMEATIQTAAIPDKGMLHRVRVGPFGSVDELNKVKSTLQESGVQSTAVKVSEAPASR